MCSIAFVALAAGDELARSTAGPSPIRCLSTAGRGSTNPAPIEFEVPGKAEMLAVIRSRVVEFARSMPFTDEQIEDIKLAVGEASANAIRHGAAEPACKVGIRMQRCARSLKVSITDQGCGFDPAAISPPAPDSYNETGRGIMVMRALVDKVRFRFCTPGTRVELIKRFKATYS